MSDNQLTNLTVTQLRDCIKQKQTSPLEVRQSFLNRIQAVEPQLNAFITRIEGKALGRLRKAEGRPRLNEFESSFNGIPIGLKDLFWTKGIRTTSGSLIYSKFVPNENSAAVVPFLEAGAYCIGKLNMPEFAFSPLSSNQHYGPVRNPWNIKLTSGGSSSGSGAAVASGEVPFALGTDAGGSIRIPASLCGITGFKPTYGLVSRYGASPLSWTLDHVGPMARSVRDVALAMNLLAGHDPRDRSSLTVEKQDYTSNLDRSLQGIRIGVPREYVWDAVDNEVHAAFNSAMAELIRLGANVEEISIPELPLVEPAAALIVSADAAAAYGNSVLTQGRLFDQEVRTRIESGLFISASAYIRAQRIRGLVSKGILQAFPKFDLLATPTTGITAPTIGQNTISVGGQQRSIREMLLRLTRIFNITGFPAISIPCGFNNAGLPIGLQLAGKPLDDGLVLNAANVYQESTDWHLYHPKL